MNILRAFRRRTPKPDLHYAAKGFVQVAISRRYAAHVNLHNLEQGYAAELMSEGCTKEQALSARWGGAYAITADLGLFDHGIAAFKETKSELGRGPLKSKGEAAEMYLAAALCVMATVHTQDPQEYCRFLDYFCLIAVLGVTTPTKVGITGSKNEAGIPPVRGD